MIGRETYAHSGVYSAGGLVRGMIFGTIAGLILGFIYPYVILYMPVVGYISFIISGGFGLLMGYAIGATLKRGKVRNKGMGLLAALPAMLVAYYFSWVVWVYAFASRSDHDVPLLGLLLSPGALWEIIGEINQVGAWSLKSFTPTGGMLWFLWAGEAVFVIGAGLATVWMVLDDPFCEECNLWTKESAGVAKLAGEPPAALKDRLAQQQLLPALEALGPPAPGAKEWTRLDLQSCPQCNKLNALTAKRFIRKGNKEEATQVAKQILLTRDEAEGVRALGTKLATGVLPAVAAAPAS